MNCNNTGDTINNNNYSEIILKSIEFVKDELKNNDPSHDWNHVERVWKLAKSIAIKENYNDGGGDSSSNNPTELLELAAILHDVKDHKYLNKGEDENIASKTIISFLTSNQYPLDKAEKIAQIVGEISYKGELGRSSSFQFLTESKIVQDADRLDAIGAVGVARCFSFGSIKNRPFYGENTIGLLDSSAQPAELSQEQYKKQTSPTIDHFYEKLLKLKSMMKTETGKLMAIQRHQFMLDFIKQFNDELHTLT